MDWIARLKTTRRFKHVVIPRLIAGAPLAMIGSLHLVLPSMSIRPILEAASIEPVGLFVWLVPVLEIVAGLFIVAGRWTRPASGLAVALMGVAIYAHLVADWEGEWSPFVPLVVLLSAAYTAVIGGGAWSYDIRRHEAKPRPRIASDPVVLRS